MSFINFLDESKDKSKFTDFKNRIKKCTKSDYDKVVKDLDTAFKDKTITSKEFDELDDELFKKIKSLQNKIDEDKEDDSEQFINNKEDEEITESLDELLTEAKADDILALYRLLMTNRSTSTWRNERKTFELDENNNLITRSNDFFRVGSGVQKQSWGKVLKLITKLFKDDSSFSKLLQQLEDESVLLWKVYFYNSSFKMMITEPSKEGETMYVGVSNKDFVKLLNKEGIVFNFSSEAYMPVDSVTVEDSKLKIKFPFLFKTKKDEKSDTIEIHVASDGTSLYCNCPAITTYVGEKVKETREKLEKFVMKNLSFSSAKILKPFDELFKTLETKQGEAELVKTVLREIGTEIGSSNYSNETEKSGYVSIKRWDKVNFIFDLDNATSADWVIERTLDKKSAVFLDKLVDRYNKKYKSKIHVSWSTSEKWYVEFKVQKI